MSRMYLFGVLACALLSPGVAQSAQPVGVTVDASTTVTGSGPPGSREIRKDSAIFQDDRLKATQSGNAQIILVDQTKIVVGPGAQVDIDDFVFATDNSFESVTIKATKGAFRFVSGKSKSSAYKIETPSGTIGVRGTAFDVGIVNGQTHVVMVRGEVEMCNRGGTCENLRGLCSYGVMGNRSVEIEGNLRNKGRAEKANFPLMQNEKALLQQFRLGGNCASTAALPPINTPDLAPAAPQQQPAPNPPGGGSGGQNPPPDPEPSKNNRSGLSDGTNPAFDRSNGKGPTNGAHNSQNGGSNNPGNKG